MHIGMLSTLVAIVEGGSLAAAAQKVGCTPSAVSLQVKQLEHYFGQPLFDRSARAVQPTPFALEAAVVARDLTRRLEQLRLRHTTAVAGRIRLGAIATVQTDVLPATLKQLRDTHPALEIDVVLGDSEALRAELTAGRIDAAVVVRPQAGGSSRLHWEDLAQQNFVMLVPPGCAPASPRQLLDRHGWIRYDPTLTGGRMAARYVRRLLPGAAALMDMRSIDAIVAMVAAGLGVSVVPPPRHALLAGHGVQARPLGRGGPQRQISLVRRKGDVDDRNLHAIGQALRRAYA